MINMRELGLPVRKWVPNWLALASVFIIILPVTMLNGSYTGSMLEVSNTLGTNTEDITMGYYAASVGMAIAYPIVPKVLAAFPPSSCCWQTCPCRSYSVGYAPARKAPTS